MTFLEKLLYVLEISRKSFGHVGVINKSKKIVGIITDGQIRRSNEKNVNLQSLPVKKIMTQKPITIEEDVLAVKALSIMNEKKVTSLCVHKKKLANKTIGLIHIHQILAANIQ